jgi:hypothetical protein
LPAGKVIRQLHDQPVGLCDRREKCIIHSFLLSVRFKCCR